MFCDGFLMLSLAIGSKLGLIELFESWNEPKTCQEIAEAAGLKERLGDCTIYPAITYNLDQEILVKSWSKLSQLTMHFVINI